MKMSLVKHNPILAELDPACYLTISTYYQCETVEIVLSLHKLAGLDQT